MRHSQRACFNNCPFKHSLEQQGLRKIELTQKAEDRNFGIAGHAALKVFYDSGSLDAALKEFKVQYPFKKDYKSKAKGFVSGLSMLKGYASYWSVADKNWEILATELADEVIFNEEAHSLHIDLIAKNRQTGEIWPWDHKITEKYLGKGFFKSYELDSQVTRYTHWVKERYGSCGGFIINGIQVGHRQRAYKGEPAGYYQKFERQPFDRSKDQIDYWMRSEKDWQRVIDFCFENDIWPRHLGSLCGWCDFYELCLSSNDPHTKASLYTTEPVSEAVEEFNVIDES